MTSAAEAQAEVVGAAPPPARSTASASAARKQASSAALSLLSAFVDRLRWGNTSGASDVIEQMATALADTHPAVASKLRRFQSAKPVEMKLPADIISFEEPQARFTDVILPADIAQRLPAILQEHGRAAELAAFRLSPRHRILLEGPPGNGKTMLAEALAGELAVPLLRVNYSGLIASHLGETGSNLAKAFRYAERAPCVLFLDEFDGIGADRATSDLGEIKRITNQLLILIDRLPSQCVLICATNLVDQIDAAVLRRFDFRLHIPAPDAEIRLRCARAELSPELTPGVDVSYLADRVAQHPFENVAALVQHCREIRRDLVLNRGENIERLASSYERRAA
ncbi:ATP-binding protein [Burkholderia sp. Ac-20365]|uniref:AAA family ATPase n=1 Tax=Burkholderia sp. Ac-20365 TaxID=2703897 RepID=UPI00197C3C3C|nr:ATP-binding protein [Burkholderia sp. Ac-20365]MBN3761242.1 AAA family ATPase [Burkholderia sp. Ac-20365]